MNPGAGPGSPKSGRTAAAVLAVAGLGALAVWFGSPHGLGLSPDSVAYLGAAQDLASGRAAQSGAHWPPGYAWLLALPTCVGLSLPDGARLLHALVMALNLSLLAHLAGRLSARAWIGPLVAAATALHTVWLQPHLVLWSEAGFLALMLANFALLDRLSTHPRRATLAALAVVAAGALLLRYSGGFLLLVNAAMLAGRTPVPTRSRWRAVRDAAVLTGVSLVPLLVWLATRDAASGAPRSLAWHPPDGGALTALGSTIAHWFQAPSSAWWIGLGLLVASLAAGLARNTIAADLARALRLAVAAYLAFLAVSLACFDANIPLDDRILLPLFVPLLLLLVHAASGSAGGWRVAGLVALVALGAGIPEGTRLWLASRHDGLGLASTALRALPVFAHLSPLPADVSIYSNGPELLRIHLQRDARMLPRGIEPRSRRRNTQFGAQMDEMTARADLLVWFEPMGFRDYLPPPAVIDRLPGFRRSYEGPDAVVWRKHR